jgi:hypothetical protein
MSSALILKHDKDNTLSETKNTRGIYSNVMAHQLEDLPATLDGYSLSIEEEATTEERQAIGRRVLEMEHEASALHRFILGDWYNTIPNEAYGDKRRFLEQAIEGYTDTMDKLFRNYGWIARKWGKEERSGNRPWSYYRDYSPGEPYLPKPKIDRSRQKIKEAVLMWTKGKWSMKRFDEFYSLLTRSEKQEGVEV